MATQRGNRDSTLHDSWEMPEEEIDAFLAALRSGNKPSIDELVARYPDQAETVRRKCRLMLFMENVISASAVHPETAETAPQLVSLNDYRILRLAGRGGMGFVYEAIQPGFSRRVAVKVLAQSAAQSTRTRRRFALEAEAASRLRHPNIVPVFDYGTDQNYQYLVMPFIDGCNLDQLIRRTLPERESTETQLPPECITAASTWEGIAILGAQAANGLHHAHTLGMIHRDVKPANLLMDRTGTLFVTDFGLARIRDEDSCLSRTGDTIGTPRYMSPEAIRGFADERSDIFGLGVTLYELVTRQLAFDYRQEKKTGSRKGLPELTEISEINPDVPANLADIIMKCCAASPTDRYQSAEELARDLNQFAHGNLPKDRRRRERTAEVFPRRGNRIRSGLTAVAVSIILFFLLRAVNSTSAVSIDVVNGRHHSGAPEFIGLSADRSLEIRVPEGTRSFNDVKLQAYDPECRSVMYRIAGGEDAEQFVIHPDTGTIQFRSSPVADRPHDHNHDGVYHLQIAVTDSARAELIQFVHSPTDGGLRTFEPVHSHIGHSPWSDKDLTSSLVCIASADGRSFYSVHQNDSGSQNLYRTVRAPIRMTANSQAQSDEWSPAELLLSHCDLPRGIRGWCTSNNQTFHCIASDDRSSEHSCSLYRCTLHEDAIQIVLLTSDSGIPSDARGLWQYGPDSVLYFVPRNGQLEQWQAVIQDDYSVTSELIAVGPWHNSLSMIDCAGWIQQAENGSSADREPAELRIQVTRRDVGN